ncbi:hypothetical protein EVAR_46490_1 [Eumeta japonica]|uniref:Uncharacterized protein n=1 Tax=Eumeta variegata TaxID=151549 RepID=A0A4C1WVP2_EUMVA|nr:hypothetical protein EVAR_46490_1 [Eumeta japonica]
MYFMGSLMRVWLDYSFCRRLPRRPPARSDKARYPPTFLTRNVRDRRRAGRVTEPGHRRMFGRIALRGPRAGAAPAPLRADKCQRTASKLVDVSDKANTRGENKGDRIAGTF